MYKELLLLVYMINVLLVAVFVQGLYLFILFQTNRALFHSVSKIVTVFRLLVGHKKTPICIR